jgi:hypothetical protein
MPETDIEETNDPARFWRNPRHHKILEKLETLPQILEKPDCQVLVTRDPIRYWRNRKPSQTLEKPGTQPETHRILEEPWAPKPENATYPGKTRDPTRY